MSPHFVLHNTLGALFMGMVSGLTLYGIFVVQAWYYFTHQNDMWPLKSLVVAVMVCDTLHQVMVVRTVYFYAITNWGNPEQLSIIVWSLVVEVLFSALVTLCVQSFLTVRLWRFSNHVILTTLTTMVVLAQFATSLAFVVLTLQLQKFAELNVVKSVALSVIALTAIGDVLVAGALCITLHVSRTGTQRSDTVINKLMLFAINTGFLTSLFAIASFISYVVSPNTYLYAMFYACLAGLYSNALLANLNARRMFSSNLNLQVHHRNTYDNVTLPLSEFSTNMSTPKGGTANNISITINTTREFVTQEQDHENNKVADLQTSSSVAGDDPEVKISNI